MSARPESRVRRPVRVRNGGARGDYSQRALPGTRLAARLGFAALVLLATLSPWRFDADAAQVMENLQRALQPSPRMSDVVDGLRNLALFAGWGVVWFATAPPARAWRVVLAATLSGAGLSLSVELLQLFSTERFASALDLLTNSAGALGGALGVALLIGLVRATHGERSFVGVPAALLAVPYGVAVMLEAAMPLFRQETLTWGGPLRRMRAVLEQLQTEPALSFPLLDVPLFLPAGAFAVAALVERGLSYRAAAWGVALVGALLSGVVEVAGGFVGQPIEPLAAVAHALAVGLGAAAAARWLPGLSARLRGSARPRALIGAYAGLLALWSWRPFLPALEISAILEELSVERLIPLRAYAEEMDLFSVVDVSVAFLLFLPLGALLAVWPLRRTGVLRHLLPALYLAAGIELGQVLVAARYFDLTDVLVQMAGAAVGWAVVRRAGFLPFGEALAPAAGLRRAV